MTILQDAIAGASSLCQHVQTQLGGETCAADAER